MCWSFAVGCTIFLVGCNSGAGTTSGTSGGPGYLTVPLAGWWHGSWSRNTTLTDIIVDTADVATQLDPLAGVARLQITSANGSSHTIGGSLMMSGFECFDNGSIQGSWSGSNVGISVYSQPTLVETAGVTSTITQVSGGSGYASVPTVTFSAPENATGDTATGHAVISGKGSIASIAVSDGGAGYTQATTTVIITAPDLTSGTQATATATVTSGEGSLASIAVSTGGAGYTQATTTVTITAPDLTGGTQATATATVSAGGEIVGFVVTEPGSGYSIAPGIIISDTGGGSGAVGTATLSDESAGQVTAIVLDSAGSGYETAPSITISGGGGTGAIFTADLDNDVGLNAVRLSLSGHQTSAGELKFAYTVASGECEAKRGSITLSKSG